MSYALNRRPGFASPERKSLWWYIKDQWQFWAMVLPCALLLFAFVYLPISGIVLAFKQFDISKGIWGSPWIGFTNFRFFIENELAWRAMRNTILLNLLFNIVGTVFAIFVAISLFEIRVNWFRRIVQSITYLPNFLSWATVSILFIGIISPRMGSINQLLTFFGIPTVNLYQYPELWPGILTLLTLWKGAGYGIIIYMASIVGINPEYYEAATIDGANLWQRIYHITLPMMLPTIVVLQLLAIGGIIRSDPTMMIALIDKQSQLYQTTDVLDFFVYRSLKDTMDVGMPAAVALFQSCIGFALVWFTNRLARKYEPGGALY